MTDWIWLLPAALFFYIFLIVAPSVVAFFSVFTRKEGADFRKKPGGGKSYWIPLYEKMCEGSRFLDGLPSREVTVLSDEGFPLVGTYIDGGYPATVILYHGYNTAPISNFALIAPDLWRLGLNLLIPDQRAHGRSGGTRSTLGLREGDDLLRWIAYAEKELHTKRIFVYGMSMGCTAAAFASDRMPADRVRGLILDCGYSSPAGQLSEDMRRRHLPHRQMLFFIRLTAQAVLRLDIRESVKDHLSACRIPVLFLHGTDDRTVPLSVGQENSAARGAETETLYVEGADHTVAYPVGGERTRNAVREFVRRCEE